MIRQSVEKAIKNLNAASGRARARIKTEEAGAVLSVEGGIIECSGLKNARMGELVKTGRASGIILSLGPGRAGVAALAAAGGIHAGEKVRRTGKIASVPVGKSLLGRVVNPLGEPLDGRRPISARERYDIERPAHPIIERAPVDTPLMTGIKAIDSIIPLGRGQRELILGDRQTGKTAIAIDAIIAQKDTGVLSIYCAIGGRADSVAKAVDTLKKHDCMKNSIVVVASGESAPGLLYIAPYAATSMAEYFMEREGRDVLIVYDNLSAHAAAYRQMSLTLRRPPGREAYPGDIFYIHSRLLERSTKLKKEYGGGSITALPICETLAENISAYIPTNLISITDGQIFLTNSLFSKGMMPAIDIGSSVSRIGSKAQLPAYREAARALKISYAQFEELEAFSKFGTQLDDATKKTLAHGERIRALLRQPQSSPMKASEQIAAIYAVESGAFDSAEAGRLAEAEAALIREARKSMRSAMASIDRGGELTAAIKKELKRIASTIAKKYAGKR